MKILKVKNFISEENIKKLIYLSSTKIMLEICYFFQYALNIKIKILNIEKLIIIYLIVKYPNFPISGDYLKEHGYEYWAKH